MSNTTRNGCIAFLIGLTIACVCLCGCSGVFVGTVVLSRSVFGARITVQSPRPRTSPTASVVRRATPTPRPTRAPLPTPTRRAIERAPLPTPSASVSSTLDRVESAVLPREDLPDLAVRFKGVSPEQARVSCTVEFKGYQVGDTRVFTLSNQDTNSQFRIKAELKYQTPNVYMWVEVSPDALDIDVNALRRAGDTFDTQILATNRAFFGDEARPGVDCDPHLYILHASGIGSTVGGYFSSPDGFSTSVRKDSNEAEMFVVNAEPGYNGANPGSRSYMSTLAHELQHMISYHEVHAPQLWLEEGASQLAERLNGYADEVSTVYSYANSPETQLNTWSESSAGENSAHYGGAYLFWSYLYDRFGEDITRSLARTPERSIAALMKTLADQGVTNPDTGQPYTFEDLFADFVVANYLGQQPVDEPANKDRFNYTQTDVPPLTVQADLNAADYPYTLQTDVSQFGAHYFELEVDSPLTVDFAGSTAVPLVPAAGAQGPFWWSNRADASDSRLTREFDLTGVPSATLEFNAWYRIEKDYDYGYVSVSTDGGATWSIVQTTTCDTSNPNGSNLGCGYTASSGTGGTPKWATERADLTPYAGQKILVRFEVVTDAGVNREGLAINHIRIPEIGYADDIADEGGWAAEGFIRLDVNGAGEPLVPQYWRVQALLIGRDGTVRLERMALAADNSGSLTIDPGNTGLKRAVLIISAATQVTTEPGTYQLAIK